MEFVTPNFVRTSSKVVSRCGLSSTTFNLNSGVYCLRCFPMDSNTFHFRFFPYSPVHYTRYWTPLRNRKRYRFLLLPKRKADLSRFLHQSEMEILPKLS